MTAGAFLFADRSFADKLPHAFECESPHDGRRVISLSLPSFPI
jgi:hypothetical protein